MTFNDQLLPAGHLGGDHAFKLAATGARARPRRSVTPAATQRCGSRTPPTTIAPTRGHDCSSDLVRDGCTKYNLPNTRVRPGRLHGRRLTLNLGVRWDATDEALRRKSRRTRSRRRAAGDRLRRRLRAASSRTSLRAWADLRPHRQWQDVSLVRMTFADGRPKVGTCGVLDRRESGVR